jgi:dimethylaniline monooxygenase (N-oxide forming)
MHVVDFRPELLQGKKVLVVGLCNSGVDTAASLRGHADTIYLSYRHGAIVVCKKSQEKKSQAT